MEMRSSRSILLLIVLGTLTACASTEPPAMSQASTSSQGTAVAAAPPSDGKPVPAGFKRSVRNGEEYFCQSRRLTGSRARTTEVCLTRDQLRRMEEVNDQYWKDAQTAGSQSQIQMDSPNAAP